MAHRSGFDMRQQSPSSAPDGGPASVTHSVAQDIDAIFAGAYARSAIHVHAAASNTSARFKAPRVRRASAAAGRLSAVAAAALIGLSAGVGWVILFKRDGARPADADLVAATAVQAAVTPPPVFTETVVPVASPVAVAVAKPIKASKAVRKPRSAAPSANGTCADLSRDARAQCMHDRLMSADRRLRRAYDRAGRAGVPRPVLVSYRNRWSSLRSQALREPGRVATGYRLMAQDLEAKARHARDRRQRSDA